MSATNAMMLRRLAAGWQDQMLLQPDEADGRDGLWLAPIAIAEIIVTEPATATISMAFQPALSAVADLVVTLFLDTSF